MENNELQKKIKELTLMLLYLNSWEENELEMKCRRSWKGYDFDVLNELIEEDLIRGSHKSKSVAICDDGIEKAKELLGEYGIVIK
jgi:hypothetical protein